MSTEAITVPTDEVTSPPPTNKAKPKKADTNVAEPKLEPKLEPKVEQLQSAPATTQAQDVEAPAPAPAPAPSAAAPPRKKAPDNVALQKLKNATDIEVYQWLHQIAGEAEVQIAVNRKEPEFFKDPITGEKVKVNGHVHTFNRTFTEEEIRNKFGGGTYQYVVRTKNERGNWEYFSAKTLEVAGDPNIEDLPRAKQAPAAGPQTIVQQAPQDTKATDALIGLLGRQLERPTSGPTGPSGTEIAAMIERAVATATAPLLATITSMGSQLEAKDKAIEAARNAPPDAFRDMMMKSIMQEQDGRIAALRTQHESELRTLKEHAREDMLRREDEWKRERERTERAHERELAALKLANDAASTSAKGMADITKHVLEAENKRLVAELAELRAEHKELQKAKNQTIKEKVDELSAIKELVGDEGEERGAIGTVLEVLGNLPVVANLADKLTGPKEAASAQQQQPMQRPKLIRDQTGQVFQRTAAGMVPLKKRGTEVTAADGNKVEIPALDPDLVKTAVLFMEAAYKNNTDPKTFAEGARPNVGASILQAIRQLGVTDFLTKVAKLEATSPLMTQGGRNWSKKVATYLLDGAQAEMPPGVDPPPSE